MVRNGMIYVCLFLQLTAWGKPAPLEVSVPVNMDEKRKFYRIDQYPLDNIGRVKIAVLDNGFKGFEPGNGVLPDSAKVVASYDEAFRQKHSLPLEGGDDLLDSDHGRMMAQIAWAMAGKTEKGPEFYLLNAAGGTNYRAAIKYAIHEVKADIILSSMNWEVGGNFDGLGYLNSYVSEATEAGIIWINAVGNYAGRVFDSNFLGTDKNGFLLFAERKNKLRVKSRVKNSGATITLAYTAGWKTPEEGTTNDLDLYLYDAKGELKASSVKNQRARDEFDILENATALAREKFHFKGFDFNQEYSIAVRQKRGSLTSSDRIRIVVVPDEAASLDETVGRMRDAVELLDATPGREVMIPADHRQVIATGDLRGYSATGPTTDGRVKPDIIMEDSQITTDSGFTEVGSSQAAAILAGIVAVMKANKPGLTRENVLSYVSDKARLPVNVDDSLKKLVALPLMDLPAFFKSIVKVAKDAFPGQDLLAGKYTSGRYALGVPEKPADFIVRLCGEKPSAHLESFRQERAESEFYVTMNTSDRKRPNPACYRRDDFVCCIRTAGQPNSYYPWEYFREEPTRFLQIRAIGAVNPAVGTQAPQLEVVQPRVWSTPKY